MIAAAERIREVVGDLDADSLHADDLRAEVFVEHEPPAIPTYVDVRFTPTPRARRSVHEPDQENA